MKREALREAYMRQCIREAIKAGHQRIAVVCGAWHVPALKASVTAKAAIIFKAWTNSSMLNTRRCADRAAAVPGTPAGAPCESASGCPAHCPSVQWAAKN